MITLDDFEEDLEVKINDIITESNANFNYRLIKDIGKGGFATVFESETFTGRKIAIKVIHKSSLITYKNIKTRLNDAQREIDILLKLKHNSIISLEKMFQDKGNVFLIMGLCHYSLLDVIHKRKEFMNEWD